MDDVTPRSRITFLHFSTQTMEAKPLPYRIHQLHLPQINREMLKTHLSPLYLLLTSYLVRITIDSAASEPPTMPP